MLKDGAQRQLATDPQKSFIVQAPAGSGKTELLTQRFLRLLGTVAAPEQIIALTFTRKAASEMRERILAALERADADVPTQSAHQALTHQYAKAALACSQRHDWQILKQPGRLKIITIDSLCQMLAHAIPLTEKQTPYAQISESAQTLYQRAVRSCLKDVLENEAFHPVIQTVLLHLDNRQDKLIDLLTQLLSTREQWLEPLFFARSQSREICENALKAIEQHELQRFINSLSFPMQVRLQSLCMRLACIENNPNSPRYLLASWQAFEDINRETASALAALLLTKEEVFRRGADHHIGLKRGACSDAEYQQLKALSKELFAELAEQNGFLDALLRVKRLPSPRYEDNQWQVLQALLTLLPLLAAHLQWVFSERNEVDFAAIAQQALLALGDENDPTDLALHLDNSIHHLLVDEFQDTSIQQFHLLEKLVQGWQPDEGKTLFLVGDPMQSIYRFRQAEVGLFLKAKQQGIGPVVLKPLELCCNFRSTETLVDWVNTQFRIIFPQQDDMESGAVSSYPSVASKGADENSGITLLQYENKMEEAKAIVDIVKQQLQANQTDSIAILVRSRSHLSHIVPMLRAEDIVFQGVEIEKLSSLTHMRDIWTLTKAMLMPANRLHWLALLRSPWCGIQLSDLHALARFNPKQALYTTLTQLDEVPNLSAEGRQRARFIGRVLSDALAKRGQQSLTDWLMGMIRDLHAQHILDEIEEASLEQFWRLLDKFSQGGQIQDLKQFEQEFEQLYSQNITPSRLQIMTIHKSKGLEFDCVIIPGTGSRPSKQDKPFLRWLKLPATEGDDLMLLSPLKAAHEKHFGLYDFLGNIAAEKDHYEQQRLLYVAVTRAKKKLYIIDGHEKGAQGSFRSLLGHMDYDCPQQTEPAITPSSAELPLLKRLPDEFYLGAQSVVSADQQQNNPPPFNLNDNSRKTGIIAHELLQWICDKHPATCNALPWGMINNRFRSIGFSTDEQQEALAMLKEQIQALFNDPVGQWLCKQHDKEHNEYALLVRENDRTVTRIIDRTFYEEGGRWIIDFKTGTDSELAQDKHRVQVNQYAELLSSPDEPPIRCGLFYLANCHWVNWTYRQQPSAREPETLTHPFKEE